MSLLWTTLVSNWLRFSSESFIGRLVLTNERSELCRPGEGPRWRDRKDLPDADGFPKPRLGCMIRTTFLLHLTGLDLKRDCVIGGPADLRFVSPGSRPVFLHIMKTGCPGGVLATPLQPSVSTQSTSAVSETEYQTIRLSVDLLRGNTQVSEPEKFQLLVGPVTPANASSNRLGELTYRATAIVDTTSGGKPPTLETARLVFYDRALAIAQDVTPSSVTLNLSASAVIQAWTRSMELVDEGIAAGHKSGSKTLFLCIKGRDREVYALLVGEYRYHLVDRRIVNENRSGPESSLALQTISGQTLKPPAKGISGSSGCSN